MLIQIQLIISILFLLMSCNGNQTEIPLLIASREAQLGYVQVSLFSDNKFEFRNSGLRTGFRYSGTYTISSDTIFFVFSDSTPKPDCNIAILDDKYLKYKTCLGSLSIRKNNLPK